MNIKKSSLMMLGLVFGVSVILYIFDVSTIPSSTKIIPTISIPTIIPTGQVVQSLISPTSTQAVKITPTTSVQKHLSETVDYTVKRFPEHMVVNITLNGSTVADLQLTQNTDNSESVSYQDAFASEIKSQVVGKNIKDINVSRVAGASYTTEAFMQAINKIQAGI